MQYRHGDGAGTWVALLVVERPTSPADLLKLVGETVSVGDGAFGDLAKLAELAELVIDVTAIGQQALAHRGDVQRDPGARLLGEAQRLVGHDVEHHLHLVARPNAHVDRLAGVIGEFLQQW